MLPDRGQSLLSIIAIALAAACFGVALWVASTAGAHRPSERAGGGDDLLIDFTARSATATVPWRVEGETDSVRHTARGLLIVSRSADDPPRLVLELDAPEESFSALEVTMAVNKGRHGRVWGSRYAGEQPPDAPCRSFPLEPGIGARTYRVDLGAGETRGAPFHSLTIQLTDEPVRTVVRRVRLVRTAGWRSFERCRSGLESTVVIGGIGVSTTPAPETGGLTLEADLPANRPRLHLATTIHPMQKVLGRPETEFRVRLEPLDGPEAAGGEAVTVFQRRVDLTDPEQRRWYFDETDLTAWAGCKVRLHLEALTWRRENGGPERLLPGRQPWALPLWGPVTISGGDGEPAPPPGVVLVLLDGVGQGELGCYGAPGGFPVVNRCFGEAAHLREAYLVEYRRDRFLQSLFQADYLVPEFESGTSGAGASLVESLRGKGFRTAAFYSGGAAENLLRDGRLQGGFELISRSEFELGLLPSSGIEWSALNPLLSLPGPLSWLGQLGSEPFFMLVHLDAGGLKSSTRPQRLAAVDRAVGRVAAWLAAEGRLDNTVFCLAGLNCPVREPRVDRGCRLWDESALIPMLVKIPGGLPQGPFGGRIFRSIDILPTLCGLAGEELKPGERAGLSLAPWLRGEETRAWPVEEVFIHQQRVGRRYLGLRRGSIKLIWRIEPLARAACYDLDADPDERVDISPAGWLDLPLHHTEQIRPKRYANLVRRLEAHFHP